MSNKIRRILVVMLAVTCFLIPVSQAKASSNYNSEVKAILDDFFKKEETLRNEIYQYGENVYVQTSKGEDTKAVKEYLKYILLRVNSIENDIDIYVDKYQGNSVDGRYLSAVKVILGYYRNAIYELLLYIDEPQHEKRFEALDRYFYNRLTAKNTADWLRIITANYQ